LQWRNPAEKTRGGDESDSLKLQQMTLASYFHHQTTKDQADFQKSQLQNHGSQYCLVSGKELSKMDKRLLQKE